MFLWGALMEKASLVTVLAFQGSVTSAGIWRHSGNHGLHITLSMLSLFSMSLQDKFLPPLFYFPLRIQIFGFKSSDNPEQYPLEITETLHPNKIALWS